MVSHPMSALPCLAQRARPAGPLRNPTFSLECCRIRPRMRRNHCPFRVITAWDAWRWGDEIWGLLEMCYASVPNWVLVYVGWRKTHSSVDTIALDLNEMLQLWLWPIAVVYLPLSVIEFGSFISAIELYVIPPSNCSTLYERRNPTLEESSIRSAACRSGHGSLR